MTKRLPKDLELLLLLLKALAGGKTRLMLHENGDGSWCLMHRLPSRNRKVLSEIVELGVRAEYLESVGDTEKRISANGLKALKRFLAGGDGIADQHRSLVPLVDGKEEETSAPPAMMHLAESPLAWLARRKDRKGNPLLTEIQVLAGERLRSDFTFASLMPDFGRGWKGEPSGFAKGSGGQGAGAMRDDVIAARQRVQTILDGLEPKCAHVLIDVCCHLKGLEAVEAEQEWPARSAKIVLQIALNSLAVKYGMVTQAPDRLGRIKVWSSDPGSAH